MMDNNNDDPPVARLSPEKHLLTKRKAAAKSTPSGVDRLNQNPKTDTNKNAGNIQCIHSNDGILMTMRNPPVPPVLERTSFFCNKDNNSHSICPREGYSSIPMMGEELYGPSGWSLDSGDFDDSHEDLDSILNAFYGVDDDVKHERGVQVTASSGIYDLQCAGGVQVNDHDLHWIPGEIVQANDHNLHWIPSEMKSVGFVPGYKLSEQYSSIMPLGEIVGSNLPLNTAEDYMMFGPSGILRSSMSMWNREKGRYGRGEGIRNVRWERLEQYYCCGRSEGCQRQIVLFRVCGGLVILERVDSDNSIIQHNTAAHNRRASGAGEMSLTIAQKMKVLDLRGRLSPIQIAKQIDTDPTIHCTNEQSSNLKELARRITKWTGKKETKDKYFRLSWEHNVMNKDEQAAILNSLMKDGSQLSPNNHYFAGTNSYKDMLETIEVIQHNFNEGEESSFVLFVAKDAAERINLAAHIFKEEDDADPKRGAVQFHCDFTHLPGNKRSQLGIVVVEDIKHKAWPVSFIVSPPESIEWATAVMEVTVDLINNNPNAKLDKALIDGAAALKNAANSLGVTARSCFTHIARLPNGTKKNGKRGTKGSLCNYLSTGTKDSTEKHLSLKDSVKVILFLLLFHFSCTTIIEVEERNTNIYSVSLNSIFSI